MSVQIFLQGKFVGAQQFLAGAADDVEGRIHWVSLLSEVLPRALLAELNLSKMLLGASGGDQFLLVLPAEATQGAEAFLTDCAAKIRAVTSGSMDLIWAATENLGDWTIVRKRLTEQMQAMLGAPARDSAADLFAPFVPPEDAGIRFDELRDNFHDAGSAGWLPDDPLMIRLTGVKHSWPFGAAPDGIPLARHAALEDDDKHRASPLTLARRARGRHAWGVLRGDVDNSTVRVRRADSVEDHVQLALLYKHFFAGELAILCSMPDFWRKVTLLYSGADDFAIYGAWDALIAFAREVQRVFHLFTEASLKQYPGPEGKTISMAIAIASSPEESLAAVYEEAGRNLAVAKGSGKDMIYLFGRPLEWKQLADAADTKDTMSRMIREFGQSPLFLHELASFYKDSAATPGRRNVRVDRPWRFHRRLHNVLRGSRHREYERLRMEMIADFTGRRASQIRLRPQGRVAVEWAQLENEA